MWNEVLEKAGEVAKSLVPLVVTGVLSLLAYVGIRGDMTVEEAVGYIVTAGLVFLVPNRSKSYKTKR